MTIRGGLVSESLKVGAVLAGLPLTVRALRRVAVTAAAPGQPTEWTLLDFETDAAPERVAAAFADVLDPGPWYVDFRTDTEVFVVFAGRVFRYPVGDDAGRAEAGDYARGVGVPESQLDWG
jgi:hypothetical protein